MNLPFDLQEWNYSIRADHLCLDNEDFVQLAHDYGTPVHIFSKKKLKSEVDSFRKAFDHQSDVEIFFAYKANSVPGVLREIHSEGIGAEVISPFELWLALFLGVPPGRIIYNGAVKPDDGLRLAIENNIHQINADSVEELKRIASLVRQYNTRVRVGLRVSPDHGWKSHFGMSVQTIVEEAIPLLLEFNDLDLCGLMIHSGTRSTEPSLYLKHIDVLLELTRTIRKKFSLEIKNIDIGGGYGVPTVRGYGKKEILFYRLLKRNPKLPRPNETMSIEETAKEILTHFKQKRSEFEMEHLKLYLEPGRSLVSNSHTLLLKVYEKKAVKDTTYLITDGGRFNCTFPMEHEFHYCFLADQPLSPHLCKYTVMGRVCSPGDWVYPSITLPNVERGNILAIADSGAYFMQFSNNFCFPRPGVVMLDGNKVIPLRLHETNEHIIAMDCK